MFDTNIVKKLVFLTDHMKSLSVDHEVEEVYKIGEVYNCLLL